MTSSPTSCMARGGNDSEGAAEDGDGSSGSGDGSTSMRRPDEGGGRGRGRRRGEGSAKSTHGHLFPLSTKSTKSAEGTRELLTVL